MKKVLNILMGLLMVITLALVGYATVSTHPENFSEYDPSISLNLIWGYALFVVAVLAALFCALRGMISNPAGMKSSILSFGLIIAVVVVAYFVAAGHNYQIPDLATNSFFPAFDTLISDASILVTYVAFLAACVVALVTEVWNAFK